MLTTLFNSLYAIVYVSWQSILTVAKPDSFRELGAFLGVEKAMAQAVSPKKRRIINERLAQSGKFQSLLAAHQRTRDTAQFDPEALLQYPPSTLGYQYAHAMRRWQLSGDYFAPFAISDHFDFMRTYALRTHDIHHVLLRCDFAIFGEMGVFSFYTGQNISNWTAFYFVVINLVRALLRGNGSDKKLMMTRAAQGYLAGRKAVYLFDVDWSPYLARDIEDVRREFRIEPLDTVNIEALRESKICTGIGSQKTTTEFDAIVRDNAADPFSMFHATV